MQATKYPPDLTILAARQRYLDDNGLGDGGYNDKFFYLRLGRFKIYLPNTKARIRAVKIHDIHHVLTEYQTTWTGEAEIGSWEIATGCKHHYVAWLLNIYAFAIGVVIAPRAVYSAFVRGRNSRNLYAEEFQAVWLEQEVGALRKQLGLETRDQAGSAKDHLAFAIWAVLCLGVHHLNHDFLLTFDSAALVFGQPLMPSCYRTERKNKP
jgi:hypothetical protein